MAPVGETITYSNFGISLAGLIVEILSGQTFADYAREKIFLPTGMAGATFVPDAETEAAMARGYNWVFGRHRLLPVRHWRPYPACSLVASARELATLMRSLLLESQPILSAPSRLFEEQYTVVSGVPGMGLGFWLDEVRGQRVAWHTGHMPGHRTGFYLFPMLEMASSSTTIPIERSFDRFLTGRHPLHLGTLDPFPRLRRRQVRCALMRQIPAFLVPASSFWKDLRSARSGGSEMEGSYGW